MATSYPQVVLLGDSLFEQSTKIQDGFTFQGALQARLIRRYDVVNRGFSGWNTANVLEYMDQIFPEVLHPNSPKIDYLVVLLGANDATLPLETVTQHVPPNEYQENLRRIINHPRIKAHQPKILLVTPPPVDEIKMTKLDMAEGHATACRSADNTALYAEKAREIAREDESILLIDLWHAVMRKAVVMTPGHDDLVGGPLLGSLLSGKQGGLESLLPDGLHMGSEAYKVFFDELAPHIGQDWALEDKTTDYRFPDWRVLNGDRMSFGPTPPADE